MKKYMIAALKIALLVLTCLVSGSTKQSEELPAIGLTGQFELCLAPPNGSSE